MRIMDKNRILQYIAGICFAFISFKKIKTLLSILSISFSKSAGWYVILCIGLVLITISLFTSTPILMIIGGVIRGIYSIHYVVSYISNIYDSLSRAYLIGEILVLVIAILLIVISLKKSVLMPLGIASSIIAAIRLIIILREAYVSSVYEHAFYASGLSTVIHLIGGYIESVALVIGLLLIGLSAKTFVNDLKDSQNSSGGDIPNGQSDQLERLTKLKALLDNGVITQDEFEKKKKQILETK